MDIDRPYLWRLRPALIVTLLVLGAGIPARSFASLRPPATRAAALPVAVALATTTATATGRATNTVSATATVTTTATQTVPATATPTSAVATTGPPTSTTATAIATPTSSATDTATAAALATAPSDAIPPSGGLVPRSPKLGIGNCGSGTGYQGNTLAVPASPLASLNLASDSLSSGQITLQQAPFNESLTVSDTFGNPYFCQPQPGDQLALDYTIDNLTWTSKVTTRGAGGASVGFPSILCSLPMRVPRSAWANPWRTSETSRR